MKNKSILAVVAFAACMLAAVPVSAAEVSGDNLEAEETVSYIVDFLDEDGSFLDSRICTYGDVLEDIKPPEQKEDDQYIYEFAGWEPQIQEVVTESALYTAVYRRISKSDGEVLDPPPREIFEELPMASTSENFCPEEEVREVTATSYDVTSFHVETVQNPDSEKVYEQVWEFSSENMFPEISFPGETPKINNCEIENEELPTEAASEETPEEILPEADTFPAVRTKTEDLPVEIPIFAEETADAKTSTVDSVRPESKKSVKSAVSRNLAASEKSAGKQKQSLPEPEEAAKTEVPFSIPVFLAGTVVGGAVCIKGRRSL